MRYGENDPRENILAITVVQRVSHRINTRGPGCSVSNTRPVHQGDTYSSRSSDERGYKRKSSVIALNVLFLQALVILLYVRINFRDNCRGSRVPLVEFENYSRIEGAPSLWFVRSRTQRGNGSRRNGWRGTKSIGAVSLARGWKIRRTTSTFWGSRSRGR